jgi:hypothetical protein
VLPIQTTGLILGDAIIFILCLNEHKGNSWFVGSDGVQIPRNVPQTRVDGGRQRLSRGLKQKTRAIVVRDPQPFG